MKIKVIFLLFFLAQLSYSQRGESLINKPLQIEYKVMFNNYVPVVKKGILIPYLQKRKSNYYEILDSQKENVREVEDPNEITQTLVVGNSIIKANFIDLEKQELSSSENITFDNNVYLVTEKLGLLKWNIDHQETLKIGDYLCNKATTEFRGRKYTAWYTNELPIPFGPWKFYGLPGLILEVFDETYQYEWIVTKIGNKTINEAELNKIDYVRNLPLKEFIAFRQDLFNKKMNNFRNNLKTRQDRGTNVAVTTNTKRQGRELLFEWEEKTKQD